jgi:TonB-linked SusC/RagA family outer membrane protein
VLLTPLAMMAQEITVSGTVTSSEDGQPMPGVSIVVLGTSTGTSTDFDGNYSITANVGDQLQFNFIGYADKIVAVSGETLNVTMSPDAAQLDEVVVTAMGIKRSQKALGYSIEEVKGSELAQSKETNVLNSLQGKVAGAQITNSSGAPGASTRIVLRGTSSLDGNNQPLFVVDGVPISNDGFGNGNGYGGVDRSSGIADINPDDVESMTVLKGPNAAALYGSRASNGVILIKTKTGSNKGLGVSVNHTTSFEDPLLLPSYQNEYGQGSNGEFGFLYGDYSGINDGVDESWGPKLDVGLMIPQFDSPVDEVTGVRTPTPWVSRPNNVKDFFETGITHTTSVSVSGANDKGGLRVGFSNLDQKGMVPNTNYIKRSIAVNGNYSPSDFIKISSTLNLVSSKSDNQPGLGYDAQNVMQQFVWFGRQVDIVGLKDYNKPNLNNPDYPNKYNWNYNYHNNPYFTLYENLNKFNRDRVFGNVMADFTITDWLSAFVRTGVDAYSHVNKNQIAAGDIDNVKGSYFESARTSKEINTDFLVKAFKEFGDIDVSLNVGGNRMERYYQYNSVNAPELAVPGIYNVANSSVTVQASNYSSKKMINSIYASGQVAFRDYLFLDFTARNDWSSTLPEDNNSYFYPSVGLSAVVSDMIGLQSDILSFAKVRASYAKVGSDTDPYRLLPVVEFGGGWNGASKSLNQFVPNTLPNATLKPQIVSSLEFGVDLRFFQNKLRFDATYYDSEATNQIINVPVSPTTGYTALTINAGKITNKGIELSIGASLIDTEFFKWDIQGTYAKNQNTVVELTDGVDQYEMGGYWSTYIMAIPGKPMGTITGPDFVRDDAGNVVHENGIPQIGGVEELGNATPDFIASIGNTFNIGGVELSVLFDGRFGGEIYSMTTTWGRYAGILEETLIGREGGIVGDGVMDDGTGNYVPNNVVVTAEEYNKAAFSNSVAGSSVFDATFIKLREARIGYTFNNVGPIKSLNLGVFGRNLAILYKKAPHIDPETAFNNGNVQGLEFGQLPSARSYGVSLNINL